MTDLESSYTYGVLKRAIAEIDRSGGQITLSDLAASVGMSAPHFQRLFSKWVGVSPKKYQQYLTLEHSKQLLSEHHSLLDAALESGLSGTGHDLFHHQHDASEFTKGKWSDHQLRPKVPSEKRLS